MISKKAAVTRECCTSTRSVPFLPKTKKAIGPVVATALLIVVALVGYSHFALLRSVHFEQVQRVSELV